MLTIDRYAYSNRLRNVDPAHKAGLALAVILLCLLLDRPAVGLLACLWMIALMTLVAGIPGRIVWRILTLESTFLVLASLGVAISINIVALPNAIWRVQVGPLWIGTTSAMLNTTAHVITRALGAASAMNFLALTTPMIDLIDLLRRLRLAPYLIDIIALMYRYIFILLVTAGKMKTAQSSRLGYRNLRRSFISSSLLILRLFVEAYTRSQRMETALRSRGYVDSLAVLPVEYQSNRRLLLLSLPLIATLFGAWWLS